MMFQFIFNDKGKSLEEVVEALLLDYIFKGNSVSMVDNNE